ncbi:MAG: hypothetical protein KatS3mg035_0917 [Bacteroidia bacterium]|nr:MAG: hypothetical protein KatS3mg035_0917 [Bacteroidia bacterium]
MTLLEFKTKLGLKTVKILGVDGLKQFYHTELNEMDIGKLVSPKQKNRFSNTLGDDPKLAKLYEQLKKKY